jgi:hypothetical protein
VRQPFAVATLLLRTQDINYAPLKAVFSISSLVAAGVWSAILPTNAQVNVTQYHNHISRDGLYIDGAFTQSAAANLTRDLNFDGTLVGDVSAQRLYIEGGPGGRAMVIAVTESNNVYALDAINGSIIWQRNVGPQCRDTILIVAYLIPWASPARPLSILLHGRSFWTQ